MIQNKIDLLCGAILSRSAITGDQLVITPADLRAAVTDAVGRLRYEELLGVVRYWSGIVAFHKAKQAQGGRQRHEDAEARKQIVADLWNTYPDWTPDDMRHHVLEQHSELFQSGAKDTTITTKTIRGYRTRPVKHHGTETP